MSRPLTECINDGCDISMCRDCGEDYTDPCAYHREHGHVASADPYGDGVDCRSCCRECDPTIAPH